MTCTLDFAIKRNAEEVVPLGMPNFGSMVPANRPSTTAAGTYLPNASMESGPLRDYASMGLPGGTNPQGC